MKEIIKEIVGVPHIIVEDGVIDNILLADSFIFNKLERTTGHGEGRLYVGPKSLIDDNFFGDFQFPGFFLKEDLVDFLEDAKTEYFMQEQDYRKNIAELYHGLLQTVSRLSQGKLYFDLEPAQGNNDTKRYYIRSQSSIWSIMRRIALPNLSYISIMQVVTPSHKVELYFRVFMNYEYNSMNHPKLLEKEENNIIELDIEYNQRSKIRQARIGQGEYRRKLLEQMPCCPITGVSDERFLIASHIKPWAKSNEEEKIDPYNGFMFTPNIDRLFDQGFVSFDNQQRMHISPWVSPMNRKRFGIVEGKEYPLLQILGKRADYLNFHQSVIFKN